MFELLFFIAILGVPQAIFTPALTYNFPHFRFFHFFYAHMMVVWVTLYFTWAKEYYPTFRTERLSLLICFYPLSCSLISKRTEIISFYDINPKAQVYLMCSVLLSWYIFSLESLLTHF